MSGDPAAGHPIECSIDLGAAGRQVGRLEVPKSTNTGGWAHGFVPIASIANGDGPTALVLGGNHGDEYEGQVAGLKLLRELQPGQVSGRVIVIPCLSPGRLAGRHAALAVGGQLQPLVPGPHRRAARTSSSPTSSRPCSSRSPTT